MIGGHGVLLTTPTKLPRAMVATVGVKGGAFGLGKPCYGGNEHGGAGYLAVALKGTALSQVLVTL
jgi:hypothetical protein